MNRQVAEFVHWLTAVSSRLTDVYQQHVADQGELLPHVLMGDITRVVVMASTGREEVDWLPKSLQRVENGLASGDEDVAELIGVSFVENLAGENAAIQSLIPSMGKELRKEVKLICGV
jgi:hypothetical protein